MRLRSRSTLVTKAPTYRVEQPSKVIDSDRHRATNLRLLIAIHRMSCEQGIKHIAHDCHIVTDVASDQCDL
jgi:hypothetical protein